MNVEPNSRKRPLEENSNSAKGVAPASKKIMGQPCSSRDEETVPDNIVKNRKKNTASRVRGPSKKQCVLEQEKQLEKENEELIGKLEELSREIEFLRNYIASKLKGQCPRCEK
jgi:septin family protein